MSDTSLPAPSPEGDARERVEGTSAPGPAITLSARVPGVSLSTVGAGLAALAVLLGYLPWFPGVGWLWTVGVLAGAATIVATELVAARVRVPGIDAVPAIAGQGVRAVFAVLIAAHAVQKFNLKMWEDFAYGLWSLLWIAAAITLVADAYRREARGAGRVALSSLGRGYRALVAGGATLSLLTLFATWGSTASWWMGGYNYSYSSYYGDYAYHYNPLQYLMPGLSFSGRSHRFALLVIAALIGLVVWAAVRRDARVPAWGQHAALGVTGVLFVWWLLNGRAGWQHWLFPVGVAAIGFGLFMLGRGHEEGPYDVAPSAPEGRARLP